MREIKFRAWDKKNKIFHYFTLFDIWKNIKYPSHVITNHKVYYIKDLPISQYTGLKDKNGKEIYEGDVVEGRKETSESCYNVKSRVSFRDGCPTVKVDKNYHPCLYECCGLEIIGNIYENPELWK